MVIEEKDIHQLSEILLLVRKCVGWSAEEFGERIGITRQSVNNLENGRVKLSKTQYIAIRSVLEDEIEEHPNETEMLKILLDAYIDHPEKYSDDQRQEIYKKASLLTPAIKSDGSNREEIDKEYRAILVALGILTANPIPWIFAAFWRRKKK